MDRQQIQTARDELVPMDSNYSSIETMQQADRSHQWHNCSLDTWNSDWSVEVQRTMSYVAVEQDRAERHSA